MGAKSGELESRICEDSGILIFWLVVESGFVESLDW